MGVQTKSTRLFALAMILLLTLSGFLFITSQPLEAKAENIPINIIKPTGEIVSFLPEVEDIEIKTTNKQAVTLKIMTRHSTTIQLYMEQAFLASAQAADNNIVDITWTQPGAEYWPSQIPIYQPDVLWGGGPTLFDTVNSLGFLPKLNSTYMDTTLARIPDTIAGAAMKRFDNESDARWVAAAISSFGFTVSHPWLEARGLPTPTHWENLSSTEFGKLLPAVATIAMGNAPGTTSNTRIYEIIIQRFGWDKGWETLTRMAGNSKIYSGSVETQNAVETGITGVSMSIDFYGYTTTLRNPDTEYIIPGNGSIINGDPISLCTYGNAPANASESFIDWVLSPEGQQWWLLEDINRMPILEDAFWLDQVDPVNPDIGPRNDLYLFYNKTLENLSIEFNDTRVLEYEFSLIFYFQAVLTDAQDTLIDCWSAICAAYNGGCLNQSYFETLAGMMGAPVSWDSETFTEAYAISINNQIGTSSAFRSTMMGIWTEAAEDQYNYVLSLVPPCGPVVPPPPPIPIPLIIGAVAVTVILALAYVVLSRRRKP